MLKVLMAACLCVIHIQAQAQGLAVVVDVAGVVSSTTLEKSRSQSKPIQLLDYLPENVQLELKPGARLQLVYLKSSKAWQFTGPGEYTLMAATPKTIKGSPAKPAAGGAQAGQSLAAIEPAHRERMALGAVVMRSNDSLRLTGPVDEAVLDTRPTLVWEGKGRFKVSVMEAAGGAVLHEAQVDALEWQVPKPLPAGRYQWRVEPLGEVDGSPGKAGFFEVLASSDPKRKLVGKAPRANAVNSFGDRVIYAAQLEQAGFAHEALLQWRKLAAERPDDPTLKAWAR